jgi:hypothetical protein
MPKQDHIPSSEITSPTAYFNQRAFLRGGLAAASVMYLLVTS